MRRVATFRFKWLDGIDNKATATTTPEKNEKKKKHRRMKPISFEGVISRISLTI